MLINEIQPFNLKLLNLSTQEVSKLKEIKDLRIFLSKQDFHPDGLFSTEIFGKVGSQERMENLAYIDLKTSILHPIIFKTLSKLKDLYKNIILSKEYAIWDETEKDFIKSNISEGQTGFNFFINHFRDIKYKETKSDLRKQYIKLMEKYKGQEFIDRYFIVIPAGLRDYTIDKDGKPSEDEINFYYRKLLSFSNSLSNINNLSGYEADLIIAKIQQTAFEIYEYIRLNVFDGKTKFIQGNWTKRSIFNGTRNVITSLSLNIDSPFDHNNLKYNETAVNLYQYLKSIEPIVINKIRNNFIFNIFNENSLSANLFDKNDLTPKLTNLDIEIKEDWLSTKGLTTLINKFKQESLRHKYVEIQDKYLALIYKGKDNTFKIIFGDTLIPDDIDKNLIKPITYAEMFYYSIFDVIDKYPAIITRYPISGLGSSYPSKVKVITTNISEAREELDLNWEKTNKIYPSFPVKGVKFFNSVAVHYTKLKRLGADFDGDTVSFNVLYTEESINEINNLLNSVNFYKDVHGKLTYSVSDDVIDNTLLYLTA